MNNEQKLRAALIALVGVEDNVELLTMLKNQLIAISVGDADAQISAAAVQVLIDTHPDNEGVRRE